MSLKSNEKSISFLLIQVELFAVREEINAFNANHPRPIIDSLPDYSFVLELLGCVLILVGGLFNRERWIAFPLIFASVLIIAEFVCILVIPTYSPFWDGYRMESVWDVLFYAIRILPGLICLIEVVYFIRTKNKKIKPNVI